MLSHKNNSKDFGELTFAEQSSSIKAQILNLKKQILAHKKLAEQESKDNPTDKIITSIENMLKELKSE